MISKPFLEIYFFQGISTMHLTPFEVLTAINHAQLHLNRTFKEEEFANGQVGKLMIAEDFDFEKTVSFNFTNSSLFLNSFSLVTNPSSHFFPTRNIIIMFSEQSSFGGS